MLQFKVSDRCGQISPAIFPSVLMSGATQQVPHLRHSIPHPYLKKASSACSPTDVALMRHLFSFITRAAMAIWGSSIGA